MILFLIIPLLALLNFAAALGLPNPLLFTPSPNALTIASSSAALPILYDSADPEAIRIAVATFAEDILRVTGVKPDVYADALPDGANVAVIVGTISSVLLKGVRRPVADGNGQANGAQKPLAADGEPGKDDWESFDARVVTHPIKGVDEALVISGSDRVSDGRAVGRDAPADDSAAPSMVFTRCPR